MARNRKPTGIRVNGVGIFVKDPNAASGKLFHGFRRAPGVGSITLPDEAPDTNTSVGIDGSVQSAGFADVGSITVPIAQKNQHVVHRFLERMRASQDVIVARVLKAAVKRIGITDALAAGGAAVAANGVSELTIESTKRNTVKKKVLEGLILSVGNADPDDANSAVAEAEGAAKTADNGDFQSVVEVEDDGSEILVAPGFAGVNTAAAENLYVRQAGMMWDEIEVTVGQMGHGDFQSGNIVTGNLVLIPTEELPQSDVVAKIAKEG